MFMTKSGKPLKSVRIGKHTKPNQLSMEEKKAAVGLGRTPRISKLICLAVHLQDLIEKGEIKNQSELASRFQVSRNRVTQILNLLLLAPDIAEEIMFLPKVFKGPDPIKERMVRAITLETSWDVQRKMWADLKNSQIANLAD